MFYLRYTLIMLTCYLGIMISGLVPLFFFNSFILFIGSYVFMSIGITILLLGLFFLSMKEDHRLKGRIFIANTIAFLLLHLNFSSYESYTAAVGIYPVIAVLTLVAYAKFFRKQKDKTKKIYY